MLTKVLNFIKEYYKTILKVVFGLFILYYLIFFLTPRVQMAADQKQQLDSLNSVIKQLHEDNLKLEDKISEFDNEIEQVDQSISKIKNQKTIVKEIYHEKISNIDKLTSREIDSFFTDRYK
jgi:vacuolar-type H+-ATPase subunit I/STV1